MFTQVHSISPTIRALNILCSLPTISMVQDYASSLAQAPYPTQEDYPDGRASGPAGVDLAANNGKVFERTQALIAQPVAYRATPYYNLGVASTTLALANDEDGTLSVERPDLEGMSIAEILECKPRYQ